MSAKILIVDDDRFLLDNLRRLVLEQGYEVRTATSGEDAIRLLTDAPSDLVILDIGLPGADGISVCRRIRAKWRMPVLMLTARTDAMDKVIGLEVGADDYLTKPFEPIELIARVRAQLRRSGEYKSDESSNSTIAIGEVAIDISNRTVDVRGNAIELTTKEFDLLLQLAKNSGRVLGRDQLFEKVWGYDIDFSSNSLDVFIYRLRQKLEADPSNPRYLHTVRGYGYKFHDLGDAIGASNRK